jgi:hypothetical protein
MRNLIIAILVALFAVACGPNAQVTAAKTAHYKGDKAAMFDIVKNTVAENYNLQKADEASMGMQTAGRWYTPEGLAAAESGGDMRVVPDNSLNIALVVTFLPDGDAYVVNVKPLMMRYHAGSPKPEPIGEDDPSVPGWAHGKVDKVAMDIHSALAQYEVKTPGAGVTPAGPGSAAAPAPAPAPAGSAAAPAPAPAAAP